MNSKSKGNRCENKEAKKLGVWFFNDKDTLFRHENSGARKNVYVGDIIPKKIENFPWKVWPFIIEIKNGYKDDIPTFCGNRRVLDQWLCKLLSEKTENQFLPILIVQYHHKQPILLTTIIFNYQVILAYPVLFDLNQYIFYIYDYKQLLEQNFYEILPIELSHYFK